MNMKRIAAAALSVVMAAGALAGCGSSSSASTAASTGSTSATGTGEKQTLEFWYHSGDPVTDAYFEDYFTELNASQMSPWISIGA